MLLARVELLDSLMEATSRLAQIAKEADVKFTPAMFWLIASHSSPRFIATLQMAERCFAAYSVDEDHNFRVSLQSFHDAILDSGASFSSTMNIHLLQKINQIILQFETSSHAQPLQYALLLSPPKEADVEEEIEYANFFSMESQDLRRIIKELPLFHDDYVRVTVTRKRVKFSVASKNIILTKQDGQCEIIGHDDDDETKFRINLNPMLFFLNMAYDYCRVWFYSTKKNSYAVMCIPAFGVYCQYVIYFPQT